VRLLLLHRLGRKLLSCAERLSCAIASIAIAQAQKARSFELRAALELAKLYQSTGRPADAHSVLALALDGFAPTPEFREIGQTLALLAALEAGAQ
jgi:hypothetical protein